MDDNLITISVSFLEEYSQAEASDIVGVKITQAGIYRFVGERGTVDCDFVGDVNQIQITDLAHDSDHFFFEREDGILMVNDSDECAPAQYIRVGDF